ncbi:MAG: cryptochrome/photolyase family protein [Chitinophagaceae bacterium]
MQAITLIFPHQLFEQHPALELKRAVVLVEEYLFFSQYRFHQQKIVLHRASMQWYCSHLRKLGYTVRYIAATATTHHIQQLLAQLATEGITEVHYADVVDDWLEQRIATSCKQHNIYRKVYQSPNFLNTSDTDFFEGRKHYLQTDFYVAQRKQRGLLVSPNNKPLGGKWTFDADNRAKFPAKQPIPALPKAPSNAFIEEARTYVNTHFSNHYGNTNPPWGKDGFYAVTRPDALEWLHGFLEKRFALFGLYEDAMVMKASVLHHSVLTPMLNIGLLQPQEIIDAALAKASKHDIPLNSVEGFIRQIVGWREFIRIVYAKEGRKQRTTNYWGFTRKIPESFWKGTTGIAPVDIVIQRLLKTGYCHHIERLMVLGNFMLLCEFDPDEVYRWFMELFIDSYDWVMVPNVYGMTQFADGGIMTTKPYISGSNYLMKMSDFPKGEWQTTWDGLFWRFMHVHRTFFTKNPRLGMLVNTLDKMDATKRNIHLTNAERFLQQLDKALHHA